MAYLLDTDSASLAFASSATVRDRIESSWPNVWLSCIAAEEAVRGTLTVINQNRDKPTVFAAYGLFIQVVSAIGEYPILPYDEQAARVYAAFSAQVKRIGTQDCRIAASAISRGWTVVTANRKDFSRIPGVLFEDWSR